MRKLIAAINMTLDGFCDHSAMIADDEIHQHYDELLSNADTLLYGRITYQLMESYWPTLVSKKDNVVSYQQNAGVSRHVPRTKDRLVSG